jgi:protein-L-isoaspartate(D-aspartate) O-methyltransferase
MTSSAHFAADKSSLMDRLQTTCERFAEDLRYRANLRSAAVIRAFAEVERERFLGLGPWQIYNPFGAYYWTTPDADPRHIYHDVFVGLDPARQLNNGQPSGLAFLIEALELESGRHVVHLGCGTGYYAAVLAHVVGETGRVTAVELDRDLANRATENLSALKQVTVISADASRYQFDPADAVLVNAGATHPVAIWLDNLRPAGNLLVPLTATGWAGKVLKIERRERSFAARFIMGINIFNCEGARDPQEEERLGERFRTSDASQVRSLRRETHEVEASCWFHADGLCLSSSEP